MDIVGIVSLQKQAHYDKDAPICIVSVPETVHRLEYTNLSSTDRQLSPNLEVLDELLTARKC